MKIMKSKRTENILVSLSNSDAHLMVSALKSFSRMRGAELADMTELSQMDEASSDISRAMDAAGKILELTEDTYDVSHLLD